VLLAAAVGAAAGFDLDVILDVERDSHSLFASVAYLEGQPDDSLLYRDRTCKWLRDMWMPINDDLKKKDEYMKALRRGGFPDEVTLIAVATVLFVNWRILSI